MGKKISTAPTTDKKSGVKVMFCGCEHLQQDSIHGLHMRVHNRGKSKVSKDVDAWVCTVCNGRK